MNNTKHPFMRIAGICLIIAPFILLAADSTLVLTARKFEWSIGLWLGFVTLIPGIIGLTYLAYGKGNRLALVGGALAFFGAMAGASMQVLFRVHAVLEEAGSTQALELLRSTIKLIATTQMIGITFPIGLILLSISLYRSGTVTSLAPVLLACGAILFPIGRIAGLVPAFLGSDVLFIAAFGLIGWHILNGSEIRARSLEGSFAEAN